MMYRRTRTSRKMILGALTAAAVVGGTAAVGALSGSGSQQLSQGSPGLEGSVEVADFFGGSVAMGDFDGDGRADAIVGAPFEGVGSRSDSGLVHVLYGTSSGLGTGDDITLHQASPNVPGASESDDRVGISVTTGDFDNDGYDDAAVGAPGEDLGNLVDAGSVIVFYGSPSGLSGNGSAAFTQATSGVNGAAEAWDEFGHSVAAGDFDGDGHDDLAVGVPGEGGSTTTRAGAVNILFGGPDGISSSGDQLLTQATTGMAGAMESDDGFGTTLAVGDFDDDGNDDLAVGVPGEAVGPITAAGAVHVIPGSATGLNGDRDLLLSQSSSGISGGAEVDDAFGSGLAAGDFDGDGNDDLAIGSAGEAVGSRMAAGMVHVLYGSASVLTGSGSDSITQSTSGVSGATEAGDEFGAVLAAGDFDGDGRDDLAVAAPGEGVGSLGGAGIVYTFSGTANGITTSGSQWWWPGENGLPGSAEANAGVGRALATGDIDGDGNDDLIIGAPGATVGSASAAGSLLVVDG